MPAPMIKKPKDDIRIGTIAAMQPLSGILRVDETGAVSGLGRGGFVREEKATRRSSKH